MSKANVEPVSNALNDVVGELWVWVCGEVQPPGIDLKRSRHFAKEFQ